MEEDMKLTVNFLSYCIVLAAVGKICCNRKMLHMTAFFFFSLGQKISCIYESLPNQFSVSVKGGSRTN